PRVGPAWSWSSLWLRRGRRADGAVHVCRQDQLGADRDARTVEAAEFDLGDVDDARELGDTLEELAELVIARLGVHRDGNLAVVVLHDGRPRLEERDGQPGRGRGIRHRPIEGGDLLLAREPILERVQSRLELLDLAAVLQEVGDDRLASRDLAL